jgi:hypothetical protein
MAATNRSRLDYFVVSKKLLEQCINCRIPNSLSSVNFDHKPVYLCFRRDNPYKKQCLNDMILKDNDLQDVVAITVTETYINHLSPNNLVSDIDINTFKIIIGQVLVNQKLLNECKLLSAENGFCQNLSDRCTVLRESIGRLLSELPSVEFLENCELSCERDIFLEILIMGIKNSSLSHQHNFFKIKNAKKLSLDKKINRMKLDFNANAGEILRTERELNNIVEQDLREEILKMKHFESLNNEKITPYFLSLAKRPQNSESLSDINNVDGIPFESRELRSTFIRNYYAETYRNVECNVNAQSINLF